MRRRALGRDHLDQRGLNTISFRRRNNAFKAVDQGAALKPSPLSASNIATKENRFDQNSAIAHRSVQVVGIAGLLATEKGPWTDLANNGK